MEKIVKMAFYALVFISLFSSVLYLGIFELLGVNISIFNSDFLTFIPLELRLGIALIIFGLVVGVGKNFID